jgi:hypothetical protein
MTKTVLLKSLNFKYLCKKYSYAKERKYKNQFFRDEVRMYQSNNKGVNNPVDVIDFFCDAGGFTSETNIDTFVIRLIL